MGSTESEAVLLKHVFGSEQYFKEAQDCTWWGTHSNPRSARPAVWPEGEHWNSQVALSSSSQQAPPHPPGELSINTDGGNTWQTVCPPSSGRCHHVAVLWTFPGRAITSLSPKRLGFLEGENPPHSVPFHVSVLRPGRVGVGGHPKHYPPPPTFVPCDKK